MNAPEIDVADLLQQYPLDTSEFYDERGLKRIPPTIDGESWDDTCRRLERTTVVCSIDDGIGLSIIEHLRRHFDLYGSDVPRVETDVFVFEEFADSMLPITKMGGQPWRDPSRPWPVRHDGVPFPFVGQIRLSESFDLIPPCIPRQSDMLLVFSDYPIDCLTDFPSDDRLYLSHLEWGSTQMPPPPLAQIDSLKGRVFPYAYRGSRCRTVDFEPEAGTRHLLNHGYRASHSNPYDLLVYFGTKIGGIPTGYYYQGMEADLAQPVASASDVTSKTIATWFASVGSIYMSDIDNDGRQIRYGDCGALQVFGDHTRRLVHEIQSCRPCRPACGLP